MSSVLLRKVRSFHRYSASGKFLIILSYPLLGLARLLVLSIPFKTIAPKLGYHHKNHSYCTVIDPNALQRARNIGRAIGVSAKYTPWNSNCFAQAIIAKFYLSYCKIDHVIYFGVKKGENGEMKAHAWVTAGFVRVSGGNGFSEFTVVSVFSSLKLNLN